MKREILTPSRCREELLQVNQLNMILTVSLLFGSLLLGLLVFVLFFLAEFSWFEEGRIDVLFSLCMVGAVVLGVGLILGIPYLRARKINGMVLEIVEDTLLFSTMRYEYYGYSGSRTIHTYYVLVFRYFGEYRIPDRPHYTWSKMFSADRDRDVFDRADARDTYYIVLDGKAKFKRPLLVYNTKEFVFCPDGTVESPDNTWRDSVSAE